LMVFAAVPSDAPSMSAFSPVTMDLNQKVLPRPSALRTPIKLSLGTKILVPALSMTTVLAMAEMMVLTLPMVLMVLMTPLTLLDQHPPVRLVDGKNARSLMVFVVVLSDAQWIPVSSHAIVVPIPKAPPKPNASKTLTRLSLGTKHLEAALLMMMATMAMTAIILNLLTKNPLTENQSKVQRRLGKLVDGKNVRNLGVSVVVSSDVMLILAFSPVTMGPSLKDLQRQGASKMMTRLSHGTKLLAPAL